MKLFGSWYLYWVSRETPSDSQPRSGSRATIPGLGTPGVSGYQGVENRGDFFLGWGWGVGGGFSPTPRWGLTRREAAQLKRHFSTNVHWKDGNSTDGKCEREKKILLLSTSSRWRLRNTFRLNASSTGEQRDQQQRQLGSNLHHERFHPEEVSVNPSDSPGGSRGPTPVKRCLHFTAAHKRPQAASHMVAEWPLMLDSFRYCFSHCVLLWS